MSPVVWGWFMEFLASDLKQTIVHCKVCQKSVATKSSRMANLFQHLKQRKQLSGKMKCAALPVAEDSRSPETTAEEWVTKVERCH